MENIVKYLAVLQRFTLRTVDGPRPSRVMGWGFTKIQMFSDGGRAEVNLSFGCGNFDFISLAKNIHINN